MVRLIYPTWHPYFEAMSGEFNNLVKKPQPQTKARNEDLSARTPSHPETKSKTPKKGARTVGMGRQRQKLGVSGGESP